MLQTDQMQMIYWHTTGN